MHNIVSSHGDMEDILGRVARGNWALLCHNAAFHFPVVLFPGSVTTTLRAALAKNERHYMPALLDAKLNRVISVLSACSPS